MLFNKIGSCRFRQKILSIESPCIKYSNNAWSVSSNLFWIFATDTRVSFDAVAPMALLKDNLSMRSSAIFLVKSLFNSRASWLFGAALTNFFSISILSFLRFDKRFCVFSNAFALFLLEKSRLLRRTASNKVMDLLCSEIINACSAPLLRGLENENAFSKMGFTSADKLSLASSLK